MTPSNSDSDLDFFNNGQRWFPIILEIFKSLVNELTEEVHFMEQFFIKMQGIYAFVCQVCFFILFDALLEDNADIEDTKADRSVVIALTSILFYSVFAYFVSRVRDILQNNRLTPIPTFPSTRQYLQWICKIILEWAKAVVIVFCLREQGMNYQPGVVYSLVTFLYYICSEKIFLKVFPELVEMLSLDLLENLEHLYVPMVLNFVAISAGTIVTSYVLLQSYSGFVLLCLYFLVYLRVKDVYHNSWKLLRTERETYRSFRVATVEDIENWADLCAVCLNTMSSARITPCNHLFHPHCLKQCLRISLFCPLCKSHFVASEERK
ncbi:unnamed protein product [Phaedon cochleariae]|uniref:RING-type domain-containing protein n=1 Tax=Phaedon cochleariae TaxID=80249 RepID=A0A9P0DRA7_PHACE|nr:unnamed protein product [Phaedon cochleariae]